MPISKNRYPALRLVLFVLWLTPTLILLKLIAWNQIAWSQPTVSQQEDPYLWLEEVGSEKSLHWARQQNAVSQQQLSDNAEFEKLEQRLLSILNSSERIPSISKYGEHYYNFWRDEQHVRGIWRRTSLDEYRKAQPQWETVLDLDALGDAEQENWVWKGAAILEPGYDRALLHLSRGGADAVVVREFDLMDKQFVNDGFEVPEAKSDVSWLDRDTIYVGHEYGAESLTDSGYPRTVKRWTRATALQAAPVVFEAQKQDIAASVAVSKQHGYTYELAYRLPTFFTSEVSVLKNGNWKKIDKPDYVDVSVFKDQLLLTLKKDWRVDDLTYPAGALLAINFDRYLTGARDFAVLFSPCERKSLAGVSPTLNFLILNEMENVNNRLYALQLKDGNWQRQPLPTPEFGTVAVSGVDPNHSDDYFFTVSDFVTPTSLKLATIGKPDTETLKSLPDFFNTKGLEISQHEAVSKDGIKIPYFQVSRSNIKHDGTNPTLLYGYGGFEISMRPSYRAAVGAAWLERGGVYVLANIRGGGEFGPNWHNVGRKENRQLIYDDFIAIAEHLLERKVTSPKHLGIQGGSNGGLLVGVMLTQRPDLFGAVLCQVPLLDMKRYNKLLAGASWMDEYGNPDIGEEWQYISRYSPYQNVKRDEKYPPLLLTTSTRDDRVHPAHARKMAARMLEYGHNVLYYENIEGGHGGSANNQQAAFMDALGYTFLWHSLNKP